MKVVVIFFFSLFFIQLTASNHASAEGNSSIITHSLSQNLQNAQSLDATHTNTQQTVISIANLHEEPEYLIGIEDDDEDLVIARRYVLLAKYFEIGGCPFLASYVSGNFEKYLPQNTHLAYVSSYKYIVQRALRI